MAVLTQKRGVDRTGEDASLRAIETTSMKTVLYTKIPALALVLALTSCGAMNVVKNTSSATRNGVARLTHKITNFNEPDIKVVKVREKELKAMPTGKERALAYEGKAKRSFWFFGGPVDFKEPALPTAGGNLDGSLLPPKPE